jgi:hypothetical protein
MSNEFVIGAFLVFLFLLLAALGRSVKVGYAGMELEIGDEDGRSPKRKAHPAAPLYAGADFSTVNFRLYGDIRVELAAIHIALRDIQANQMEILGRCSG